MAREAIETTDESRERDDGHDRPVTDTWETGVRQASDA